MRILVLGGTAWLGGEIARRALERGHSVTCLARGQAGPAPAGTTFVASDRGLPTAYGQVSGQDWDLVLDVSWQPGQVRGALEALAARARQWVYVSSCSVYADHSAPGQDESAALLPPLEGSQATGEDYGAAKVACERLCTDAVGDRLLVARAGLIGGYGDPMDRFGYWPGRMALAARDGGPVLVPAEQDAPVQVVDVGDLARWLVDAGAAGLTGTYDAVGPRHTLAQVLQAARTASGWTRDLVPAPSRWLRQQEVEEFMGPRSLPLWLADPDWAGFLARSGASVSAAGLSCRPLADLVADSLRWELELGLDRERRAGLGRAEELKLLAMLGAAGGWSPRAGAADASAAGSTTVAPA
jgi:2'-hydroxyisoflavone reductase